MTAIKKFNENEEPISWYVESINKIKQYFEERMEELEEEIETSSFPEGEEREFIPYEQALALKELGFDKPCFGYYNDYKDIISHSESPLMMCDYNHSPEEEDSVDPVSAPLYQQAFRWFREKHKLFGFPKIGTHEISYNIFDLKEDKMIGDITTLKNEFNGTPEEAELECLKKLIEIVKK